MSNKAIVYPNEVGINMLFIDDNDQLNWYISTLVISLSLVIFV